MRAFGLFSQERKGISDDVCWFLNSYARNMFALMVNRNKIMLIDEIVLWTQKLFPRESAFFGSQEKWHDKDFCIVEMNDLVVLLFMLLRVCKLFFTGWTWLFIFSFNWSRQGRHWVFVYFEMKQKNIKLEKLQYLRQLEINCLRSAFIN